MIVDFLTPDNQFINALVMTLLHSSWQFILIALLMSALLKKYGDRDASARYVIASGSLIGAVMIFVVTFAYYFASNQNQAHQFILFDPVSIVDSGHLISGGWSSGFFEWIEQNQIIIFNTWLIGVILFSIRFVAAALYSEFLSYTSEALYCQDTFRVFRKVSLAFDIKRKIKIGTSRYIQTPALLGLINPIIIFPISMLNQLEIKEAEAIIAHELAHFVRKDIYVNILQNLIEVLLFYHPAIWWISANIKLERENSCDDIAASYTCDKVLYAKTLVKVQELSQSQIQPVLAMYFSKNESYFSNRIKRILNMSQTRNYLKEKVFTSVLLLIVMMMVTKNMTGTSENTIDAGNTPLNHFVSASVQRTDSIPYKKESVRIQKKTNDKDIKISMEDGKITELEIDGQKIDEQDYGKYEDIIAEVKPKSHGHGSSKMFFFDGDQDGPMMFKFGHDLDSMKFDFKSLKDLQQGFGSFHFDQELMNERMKKMLEDNKIHLKEFRGKMFDKEDFDELNKSFGLSKEEMNKLRKEMEQLRFNFRNLDSLDFGLKGFSFPEFRWNDEGDGDVRIFRFGDDMHEDADMISPENRSKNFSDVLGSALNRDGLLIPGEENKVELTGKHLKINGEKQPNNIYQKYKRIFEESSGTILEKNSKLQFTFTGKESKRKYRVY